MTELDPAGITLYVVRFSNYEPAEIDSIWRTQQGAEARLAEFEQPHMWEIGEWETND